MLTATAADGTRIAYQDSGRGPALVLLAGQANNHRWWDSVRPGFENAHRTVSLDWRGIGHSDKPDSAYSTSVFADDVASVLDHAGIEQADVYGTSMGGRVAQLLAVRHAGRVRRLVLGCTSPGGPHRVEPSLEVVKGLMLADPAAAQRFLLELMYTPGWLADHPGPHRVIGDHTTPAHAQRGHLRASRRHDAWDVLRRISAPTLILHGSDDLLTPAENAYLLDERLPDSRMHVIPGARHAYFDEFADVATPVVLDFLGAGR